jgi:hypothetical protein
MEPQFRPLTPEDTHPEPAVQEAVARRDTLPCPPPDMSIPPPSFDLAADHFDDED